jgi:hypothetical protein
MAKDYKTVMRERRARGGVPQIDPDEVVAGRLPTSRQEPGRPVPAPVPAGPPPVGDPRRMAADTSEPKTFQGFRLPPIRARQIKYEAADKGIREGEVVDRALDLYFKTHYPRDGDGGVKPLTGGKHGNMETA